MTQTGQPREGRVPNQLVILLTRQVEHHLGQEGVVELLRRSGDRRPLAEIVDPAGTCGYTRFRALLEAALPLVGGPAGLEGIGNSLPANQPRLTTALETLASPHSLFSRINASDHALADILVEQAEQVGPMEWVVRGHMAPGLDAFPELCAFAHALRAMYPVYFGYETAETVEETCQHRGDDVCTTRVRWEASEETQRHVARYESRVAELGRRQAAFRATVSAVAVADTLETALERIVRAAASEIGAPGMVLAITATPELDRHVHGRGVGAAEAEALADLLLGEDPDQVSHLIVEVTSPRGWYGRLAVVDPERVVLEERQLLECYADLAATALDSAAALQAAQREANRAHTLLDLASALSDISTIDEMARSLARAVPAIAGADRAIVILADRPRQLLRIVASHGFEHSLAGVEVAPDRPGIDDALTEISYFQPDSVTARVESLFSQLGSVAGVVIPVIVGGTIEGWLYADVVDDGARLLPHPELESRLRGLAAQASAALRNARLVEQISHQALHDALTGLPNRTLILDRAEQMLARSRREQTPAAALFLDLDGFKEVNDTLGHDAGDQLLRAVTDRLASAVRESDTLARLGGDEFVVLVEGSALDDGPEVVASRLLDVLADPFTIQGTSLNVTASIGLAIGDRSSAGDLLRDADIALYQAKAAGKRCFKVFVPEMQAAIHDRLALEADLRRALAAEEFFLLYQPVLDLTTGAVKGVEALLRWRHPERGVVAPDQFIPSLEETGLIVPVGRWVLQEACRQAARWHEEWTDLVHPFQMAVNVSVRQLESDGLLDDVTIALALSGLDARQLVLEITETAIMSDAVATRGRLEELKALGVRIAIDDFGTGYSSLSYLRQFPVDALKIDRSFINSLGDSTETTALVHTLVSLGKALGLETVAEGIEETDQHERLQAERCDSGQGFLFARPLTPEALEAFVREPATTSA